MKDLSGKRWMELIDAANNSILPGDVYPPIKDENESRIYNSMLEQIQRLRKINPNAVFSPVEIEYDDPSLDIYRDDGPTGMKK